MVQRPTEPGTYAVFHTSKGDFVAVLHKDKAPKTVANFVGLAKGTKEWTDPKTRQKTNRPLYSGVVFHRVIPEFMIQGGDPLGTGRGGPGYQFEDEFHRDLRHDKPGILSMANSGPNSNGSQFFVTVTETNYLNRKHSVFGEVIEGYEVVEAISEVDRDGDDRPRVPVTINSIEIVENA